MAKGRQEEEEIDPETDPVCLLGARSLLVLCATFLQIHQDGLQQEVKFSLKTSIKK